MKKANMTKLAALLLLMAGIASCSKENGVLLQGKLVGATSDDAIVTYVPNGSIYDSQVTNFEVKDDGLFSYDTELAKPEGDVTIEISGVGYYGAHLVKGETLNMTIEKQGDEWVASFEGEKADLSRYVNRYTQAFDAMKYWSPDPSESKPIVEYRQLLDNNYKELQTALTEIADETDRDYYTRLTESQYKWLTIRLIMDSCENDKTDYQKNAEFQSLVKDIDVNDPINLVTNMAYTALGSLVENNPNDHSNQASCLRLMEVTDSLVTNPDMRHFMVQMIGQQYFVYGDGSGDYESFIKQYVEWAGADKEIAQNMVDAFLQKLKAKSGTQVGQPAPDITLTTPEGKEVQLSSLLQGKFTYIDVWATWCGPCCKEIPFVEKLVARFKGNDKVQFLSISCDENEEAWHKKLEKDKPQWQQYILKGDQNAKFSKDWAITGIPRFIMINPDGTIFSADATRPSDDETAKTIEEQAK